MYSDYRFLAPGVADDNKKFGEQEAQTWILANRDNKSDGVYEICFLTAPNDPRRDNFVKFIADDAIVNYKEVKTLKRAFNGKTFELPSSHAKFGKEIEEFLSKNKTPTLGELRELNQKLMNSQKEAQKETEAEPEMC